MIVSKGKSQMKEKNNNHGEKAQRKEKNVDGNT